MEHVQDCVQYQEYKEDHVKPVGLIQPLSIPQQKWKDISMDFITELPKVQDKDNIFLVVDRLTKFSHLFAIIVIYIVMHMADLFFKEIFRLHGLPRRILSDRHNKFISLFWHELF